MCWAQSIFVKPVGEWAFNESSMPLQVNRTTEHRPACRGRRHLLDPLSPYAVAKLAGEMYLRAYAEMYGLSPICLALANVYGPRQNPHGSADVSQFSAAP